MLDWFTALVASVPWILIVGLLAYFVRNPEKVDKWGSIIAKSFSWAGSKWEKACVAKDIQADINGFAKKTNAGMKNPLLRYNVKISWVSTTSREAFLKDGNVVVKMQKHDNQAKNFLYALTEWTFKGVIPESRFLIDKNVLRAIDLTFMNKVLDETKRHDSKQLFIDEFFEPEATTGSLVRKYCTAFSKLDRTGLFTGIVLPEYSSISGRVDSSIPNEKVRFETVQLAEMLEKLSRKKSGVDVSPNYKGEKLSCSIVLIARPEVYYVRGLLPYLSFINQCCESGTSSFYVSAIGDVNVGIARKVRDAYENSKKIGFMWEKICALEGGAKSAVLHFEFLAHS